LEKKNTNQYFIYEKIEENIKTNDKCFFEGKYNDYCKGKNNLKIIKSLVKNN